MEEYLEKRKYVYRKSYKYYNNINIGMHLGEIIFTGSSLTAFVFVPLAVLSLGSAILMGLNEILNIKEKMLEFKKCYKFYRDMSLLFKSNKITEIEIYNKEHDFLDSINYFAVEKYLKKKKLNGYN